MDDFHMPIPTTTFSYIVSNAPLLLSLFLGLIMIAFTVDALAAWASSNDCRAYYSNGSQKKEPIPVASLLIWSVLLGVLGALVVYFCVGRLGRSGAGFSGRAGGGMFDDFSTTRQPLTYAQKYHQQAQLDENALLWQHGAHELTWSLMLVSAVIAVSEWNIFKVITKMRSPLKTASEEDVMACYDTGTENTLLGSMHQSLGTFRYLLWGSWVVTLLATVYYWNHYLTFVRHEEIDQGVKRYRPNESARGSLRRASEYSQLGDFSGDPDIQDGSEPPFRSFRG